MAQFALLLVSLSAGLGKSYSAITQGQYLRIAAVRNSCTTFTNTQSNLSIDSVRRPNHHLSLSRFLQTCHYTTGTAPLSTRHDLCNKNLQRCDRYNRPFDNCIGSISLSRLLSSELIAQDLFTNLLWHRSPLSGGNHYRRDYRSYIGHCSRILVPQTSNEGLR